MSVTAAVLALATFAAAGCTPSAKPTQQYPAPDPSVRTSPFAGVHLVDTAATPTGWAPISYESAQISVPGSWFVENPGIECGEHDAGRVFINESARVLTGSDCGSTINAVTIRPATTTAIPHRRSVKVNGIHAAFGFVRNGDRTTYEERGLGLDITAVGPDARGVLRTLTHSPLSVVLKAHNADAPHTWRQVDFGGLEFDVPATWHVDRESGYGGCPYNLPADVLQLNTARTVFNPGCPSPPDTAASDAGVAGMTVAAGPAESKAAPNPSHCRLLFRLRICVEGPPLRGGYPQNRGLEILTAYVYKPNDPKPVEIEIGLNGNGTTPAFIYNSLNLASHTKCAPPASPGQASVCHSAGGYEQSP